MEKTVRLLLPLESVFPIEKSLRIVDFTTFLKNPVSEDPDIQEYEEELQEILFSETGWDKKQFQIYIDDPEYSLITWIATSVVFFIIKNKSKILKQDLTEIIITVSEESVSAYCYKFNISNKEALIDFEYLPELIKSIIAGGILSAANYPSVLFLFISQLFEKWQTIKEKQFELLNDPKAITDLLNFNIDPALFSIPEVSAPEKNKLLQLTFATFISHYEDIHPETRYFIEHLNEMDEIPHENLRGYSLYNEDKYSEDYISIHRIINKLYSTDPEYMSESTDHPIDSLEVLDTKVKRIINEHLKATVNRYVYIICEDDYIKNEIINYCSIKLHVTFQNRDASEIYNSPTIGSQFICLFGLDSLNSAKLGRLWNKLEQRTFKQGFTICFGSKIPEFSIRSNDFIGHLWKYEKKILLQNMSLIFHSILSKIAKSRVSEQTMILLRENKFKEMFDFPELRLDVIHSALEAISRTIVFEYSSTRSWYLLRQEYSRLMNYLQQEANNENVKEIKFAYKHDTWIITGLGPSTIEQPHNTSMLYLVLILKYNLIYKKGIHCTHLKTISYYYQSNKKKQMLNRCNRDNYTYDSDYETIRRKLRSKSSGEFKRLLKPFVDDHIKFANNRIKFTTELPHPSGYVRLQIDDAFSINLSLFEENYKEYIKKELKLQ